MISLGDYIKSLDWRMRLRLWWARWKWPNGMHWRCSRVLRHARETALATANCSFVGDGPTYLCLLCGKPGTEHKSLIVAERNALQARVYELEQRLVASLVPSPPLFEHTMQFSNPPRLPCAHCGKTITGTYYCLTSENRVWCSDFCRAMRDVEKREET